MKRRLDVSGLRVWGGSCGAIMRCDSRLGAVSCALQEHGAGLSTSFSGDVTHVLCGHDSLSAPTSTVSTAVVSGVPLVLESFVDAAIAEGSWRRVDPQSHHPLAGATEHAAPRTVAVDSPPVEVDGGYLGDIELEQRASEAHESVCCITCDAALAQTGVLCTASSHQVCSHCKFITKGCPDCACTACEDCRDLPRLGACRCEDSDYGFAYCYKPRPQAGEWHGSGGVDGIAYSGPYLCPAQIEADLAAVSAVLDSKPDDAQQQHAARVLVAAFCAKCGALPADSVAAAGEPAVVNSPLAGPRKIRSLYKCGQCKSVRCGRCGTWACAQWLTPVAACVRQVLLQALPEAALG